MKSVAKPSASPIRIPQVVNSFCFFQAEDGIRDVAVTGVQTCGLPISRLNGINIVNPTLGGAGPAALTDMCVFRFNAAAGTHKAVDAGTTKTTPGTVSAWIKHNVNGKIGRASCRERV